MFAQFQNYAMRERDTRLKTAKKESDRCARDLRKDRGDLERKEKQLMADLRGYLKTGDIPKAKTLARQMAHYRDISNNNFARSAFIQTETQIRVSNHKINQAHIEFLKGMNYANFGETINGVKAREKKYHARQELQEAMESILNEGFQEVYEEQESERPEPTYFDAEVQAIMREALDATLKTRDYSLPKHDPIKNIVDSHVRLFIRIYDSKTGDDSESEAAIAIPTLEISADMLKRYIQRDSHIIKQLGVASVFSKHISSLQIGTVTLESDSISSQQEKGTFCAFEPSKSLKSQGLNDNHTIWIFRQ